MGLIGTGYVGLTLALRFSEADFLVTGFDVYQLKLRPLRTASAIFPACLTRKLLPRLTVGSASEQDNPQSVQCDAIVICVLSPLDSHQEPDLSFITDTMDSLADHQ